VTERTPWLERIAAVVAAIPRGHTASYSQVALMAGKPGAARAVVRALHALDDVPWWRVVKSDGTVAREMFATQAPRLRREGVQLSGRRVVKRGPDAATPARASRARIQPPPVRRRRAATPPRAR
jgi:methylated-DNA-protein-cysteine methyltransferase-like protein